MRLSIMVALCAAGAWWFLSSSKLPGDPVIPRDWSQEKGVEIFNFVVMATNDLHSAFLGSGPDHSFTSAHADGDPVIGHYARLCHLIQDKRTQATARGEQALVLDAGDFFAGSAAHVVGPSKASKRVPELEFFNVCGYDLATLGNHDFEAGTEALFTMLNKARNLKLPMPIVQSNIDLENSGWAASRFNDLGLNSTDITYSTPSLGPMRRILLQTLTHTSPSSHDTKSLRVGFVGVHGPDASWCNLASRLPVRFVGFKDNTTDAEWEPLIKGAQQAVDELRQVHHADIIIVLAHMGHPEDYKLVQGLKRVNLIIASHTHQTYLEQHGNIILVQSHRQGEVLRHMRMQAYRTSPSSAWELSLLDSAAATLLTVDDSIPVHEPTLKLVQEITQEVDKVLAASAWAKGLQHSQLVYKAPVDKAVFGHAWPQKELARVLGDLIVNGVNRRLGSKEKKIDLFIGLVGMVRGYPQEVDGMISLQFSDVFKMYQQGWDDATGDPGSPLCIYYLKKNELWNFFEVGDWVARFWQEDFLLAPSSRLNMSINPHGIPFLTQDAWGGVLPTHASGLFDGKKYDEWPDMLRLVTSCWMCGNLFESDKATKGFLSAWPRKENGEIMRDVEEVRRATPKLPNAYALLVEDLERHDTNVLRATTPVQ